MTQAMYRGKQQILYNYLPGRTFDFEGGRIARVTGVRGVQRTDLSLRALLLKVKEEAEGWPEQFRPTLQDRILDDLTRFVLISPEKVEAELFPRIFWCSNRRCGRVLDLSDEIGRPQNRCPVCRDGELNQLRFIKIHRCGHIEELAPPWCGSCRTPGDWALDTRGSERLRNFVWICRACGNRRGVFGGNCGVCNWDGDAALRRMDIEVHRANRTFYSQTTTLLNVPNRDIEALFSIPDWASLVAAKFLELPEVRSENLSSLIRRYRGEEKRTLSTIPEEELEELLDKQERGEITPQEVVERMQELRAQQRRSPLIDLPQRIQQGTGVSLPVWERAAQDLVETLMPLEIGQPKELFNSREGRDVEATTAARNLGLVRTTLVQDFPIILASYGYTRSEAGPSRPGSSSGCLCRLNAFPPVRDFGGRLPIFVDEIRADAILFRLDPDRIITWLDANDISFRVPRGADQAMSRKAFSVAFFREQNFRETIEEPGTRLVFGLLHTFSHLMLRQAALLSGLDRTSLSEFLLPRSLSFAIYCNHRFGATIGALTALFEQSLPEWFGLVVSNSRCVYDPVCFEREGACHACAHLAETSCRFFNLNLNRAFLFGGPDPVLDGEVLGYLDPSLSPDRE